MYKKNVEKSKNIVFFKGIAIEFSLAVVGTKILTADDQDRHNRSHQKRTFYSHSSAACNSQNNGFICVLNLINNVKGLINMCLKIG